MKRIIRRLLLALLATCTLLSGGALAFSPSALAAGEFVLKTSFGAAGEGNGEFKEPHNMSVQQSNGDIFVADTGNRRVEVFAPDGEYLSQISGVEVPGGFGEVVGVAVDNSGASAGDLYVADISNRAIDKFRPLGASPGEGYEYLCQINGSGGGCGISISPSFGEPTSVAVDGEGDVYVSFSEGSVEEYSTEGDYLAALGPEIFLTSQIAVNATGSAVYVTNLFGNLIKLSVEPVSHVVLSEAELAQGEGVRSVAIDQATGRVFVDHGSGGVKEYEEYATSSASEEPLEEFGGHGEIGGGFSTGIAYSAKGGRRGVCRRPIC